jgi:predicted nuclease of predicted toxin-antitoxin system
VLKKSLADQLRITVMKVEDFEFGKKKRDPIINDALLKDKIILIGKDSDLL